MEVQVEILWPEFKKIGIHEDFFTVRMESAAGSGQTSLFFRDAAAWATFVDSVNGALADAEADQ